MVEPNGDSYQGLDFVFEYDPAQMTLTKVAAGAAAASWMLQHNIPEAGRVMVSMASSQQISTSEDMVELTFQLVDTANSYPLYLTTGNVDEISIPGTMALVGKQIIAGDVNQDGLVNLSDAIIGLQIVAGMAPSGTINIGADVNADGKIGIKEVIYVLRKGAEL
jgi:hypothetical protein